MNMVPLKKSITVIIFFMIYPVMINLNILDVLKGLRDTKIIGGSIFVNFVVSPIIAIVIRNIFFSTQPELFTGLLLIALIPTSGMTASWTGIANGDLKASLTIMSTNLLLSMLIMPFYLNVFMPGSITVKTNLIIMSLLKVVLLPLFLGDLTRRFLLKFKTTQQFKQMKPIFGGISSLTLLAIVFVAMGLKSKTIINNLSIVIISIVPITLYYALTIFIAHNVGQQLFEVKKQISLVYSSTLRNLTISLGIAFASFNDSLAILLITLAYLIQIPIGALYHNYLKKN